MIGVSGLESIINQRDGAVGDYITAGADELYGNGNELYCTQQQRNLNKNDINYQIKYYVEITGNKANFAHVMNGETGKKDTVKIEELTTSGISGDYETGLLGIILTQYDDRGYHGTTQNNISKTQRALWYFLLTNQSWVTGNFGPYYINTKAHANEIYGQPYYQECQNLANAGELYQGTVRVWWIAPVDSDGDYQSLMIVDKEDEEVPTNPEEPGEIVIDKIDIDSRKKLRGVSFTIQCVETSVLAITPDEEDTSDSTEGATGAESTGNNDATGENEGSTEGSESTEKTEDNNGEENESGSAEEEPEPEPKIDYTNKYVKSVDSANNVTEWTENESEAMIFTTGSSSYKTIKVKGLPEGVYLIKEVQNNNEGYDWNVGLTWEEEVTGGETTNLTLENKKLDSGDGNVSISGTVWEDTSDGKGNGNNNRKDGGDTVLQGIKVSWKSADGTILAQDITDKNGYYEMYQNISISNHTYSINSTMYNRLNNSYIEFEYNGLKYTTIATSKTGSDTSKATEITSSRKSLDNSFKEVTRDLVRNAGTLKYDSNKNSSKLTMLNDKKDSGEQGVDNANGKYTVAANTKLTGISNLLSSYADTETSTYCVKHTKRSYTTTNSKGEKVTRKKTVHHYAEREDGWTITDMNLGLIRREQPDIALTSDIEKVRVIMKGQEYTYVYGNRGIGNNEALFDYKVKFQDKYTEAYKRPVNPADIAYVLANGTDELKVYVTYNIIASNQSSTLSVTINDIVNYYDKNYSIVSGGWTAGESVGGYNSAHSNALAGTKLAPGSKSEIVKIEFEVSQEAIKGLQNNEATLKNVSEIYSYSTWYGSNTTCAEDKTAREHGRTGDQYAGIDVDSRPGSATPGNVSTYEDDTDQAPSFVLEKDPNYKIISGTVWEDSPIDESLNRNERYGDGVKSGDEDNKVANVRVELLKVKDDGTTETAKLYSLSDVNNPKDAITYTDSEGNYQFGADSEYGIVVDYYIIKYTYGNDTSVLVNPTTINGSAINARNYKSTLVTQEPLETIMKRNTAGTPTEEDLEWHLNVQDNTSVAVDNIEDLKWNSSLGLIDVDTDGDKDARLEIRSLMNSNFYSGVNVSAYSLPFKVQLEYTSNQQSNVGADGGNFEHNWGMFDFGIIERARENISVDKTISQLKITLANGQVLTEGDPHSGTMNYVRALEERESILSGNVLQRKIFMEMDSELIQGATLEILYRITVANNSEIDYEYAQNNHEYYYYGENPTNVIKQSVEYLVDYIDPDLTCEAGEGTANAQWQKIDANTLYSAGNIQEDVYHRVKPAKEDASEPEDNGANYLIFVTNQFKNIAPGEQHSETLYASKLLANQTDDHVYENHTEIIQLDGRIARTINSTNDGVQVEKTYIPGNYIPSLKDIETDRTKLDAQKRLHEQDDSSITVYITPPTGLPNNIMLYVTTGLVALVVIGTGIYVIKRRIIK